MATVVPLINVLVSRLPRGMLQPASIHVNPTVVAFTFGLCMLTGVLVGLQAVGPGRVGAEEQLRSGMIELALAGGVSISHTFHEARSIARPVTPPAVTKS